MTAALGFGISGPHGANWFRELNLARLIEQAIDGGIRHFDTAPFYGESEARLGRALRAINAADVKISTKTGTRRVGRRLVKDFSESATRADVEQSLKRLYRDQIDTLYLHGPTIADIDAAMPTLSALKAEGKVTAIGVCGEGEALDYAVALGFDAIMGVFSIIDRRHAGVFARGKSQGVHCVAIAPLAQGAFAERKFPRSFSDLWRHARAAVRGGPARDLVEMARGELARVDGLSPSGAALAFVLQEGSADLALTTTSNPAHLAQSLTAARFPLESAVVARLSALALDPIERRS